MTKEKLKNCPFCGGIAKFRSTVYGSDLGNIYCTSCHASTGGDLQLETEVPKKWNTRTTDNQEIKKI